MSWKQAKIGDVCKTGAGGTPLKSRKEFYEGGDIPWLQSGEVSQGEVFESRKFISEEGLKNSSAKMFPPNTVLVAMYGANAGQVGILRFSASTNQAICGVLPNEKFLPEFIYYALLSKQSELISKAAGNAQPNISQIKIKNTDIPLIPLPEQKRIVAILAEAFAGIDHAIANTEKNLASARELFESYLNTIFTQKGDGWNSHELINLVKDDCSLSYGIVQPGQEFTGGLPVVRPTDLKGRVITKKGLKLIDPIKAQSYQRTILQGNDLLLCVRGSTGDVSFAAQELKGANVTRGIVPIRFDDTKILQQFGYYALIAKPVQDQIAAGTYGAALMQINIRDLKKIEFNYPLLDEQKIFIKKLKQGQSLSEELSLTYNQKLTSLNELKQSLLQKAFRGELTADMGDAPQAEAAE